VNPVLPFEGFLDVLRARGYGIGLNEYFQLGALVERWDDVSPERFRDAVAALIARNDDEVRGIRQLFEEIYIRVEPPPPPPPPPPARNWRPLLAAVAVLAGVSLIVVLMWPPAPPPVPPEPTPPIAVPDPRDPVRLPPPDPPASPDPPIVLDPLAIAIAAGAVFLLGLAGAWYLKARNNRAAWLRNAWLSALSALPGPFHFNFSLDGRATGLQRGEIEDVATILARAFTAEAQTQELDVRRSVRQTIRHGLMPHVVFKPRRQVRPILVLQDVGPSMRAWHAKVESILKALQRQGIPFDRGYFDADLRFVSDKPHATPQRIETTLRRRPDSPVLVVSTGAGLAATLAQPDAGWQRALSGTERLSWVTPVTDARLQPGDLATLGVRAWPLTPAGLSAAARELAGIDQEPVEASRARDANRVGADDIERVKRLASLVSDPTPALVDLLRRRFAPDVPEAVLDYLLLESATRGGSRIRFSTQETRRCIEAVRRETPGLEAEVRAFVLRTLLDSEPAPGSAAHLRWEAAVALHQIALADLRGETSPAALQTLGRLGQSPIWEEVRRAARLSVPTPELSQRVETALGAKLTGREGSIPPAPSAGPGAGREPRTWPGAPQLINAVVLVAAFLIVARTLNAFPQETIPNVNRAYELTSNGGPQTPATRLEIRAAGPGFPQEVDVYRRGNADEMSLWRTVPLAAAPAVVALQPGDLSSYFQVRARLPRGNFALSNPLWVPSGREVIVLLDVSPWANVTVRNATGVLLRGTTPYVVALEPGQYTLELENGGVTPPDTESIYVGPSTNRLHFIMPGFKPDDAAAALVGRGRSPARVP
jgi:hypothetical protein